MALRVVLLHTAVLSHFLSVFFAVQVKVFSKYTSSFPFLLFFALQVKVISQYVHTTPKWFCAGGNNGVIIATNQYNNIDLDLTTMTATIDSGVMVSRARLREHSLFCSIQAERTLL